MFALAIIALITTGTTMAQRGYGPGYNNGYPTPNQQRYDDIQDEIRIDRLDAIVGLSRHQARIIRRIEEHYDQVGLMRGSNLSPWDYQRLQWQKNQKISQVLTPIQRDRLYAFQQNNRRGGYGRGGYGGYGHDDYGRGGYGGYGRRG